MEMLSTRIPDNNNRLLYIEDQMNRLCLYYPPRYRGYRKDYLLKNLTELEESYVICPKCEGIMRDAVVYSSCISCKLCSESKEAKPIQKVRDSISKLEIRCPLQRDCDWKGILSQAEQHLEVCEYFYIKCPSNCMEAMTRPNVLIHTETSCPKRIVPCEHCKRTGKAKNLEEHLKECPEYPILCANQCGDEITRGEVEEHKEICPRFELSCPFEDLVDSEIECSEDLIEREDIPEHNEQKHIVHLDMLHRKVLSLEDRLNEMELKLKCQRTLDGCEWELKDPFSSEYREGPEFYVHGYKLRIKAKIKQKRILTFRLTRIRGDNDKYLGADSITECRIVLIDRDKPSKSEFNSFPLDYELKTGSKSEYFGTTRIPQSDTNPLFRFYFDINNTQLGDIKSSYEKQVEPVPTTF